MSDTHGFVPALEAVIRECRLCSPDLIVHCGDLLAAPFSPDPPGETIALARAEDIRVVYENNEPYLHDWAPPRCENTIAARRRRPDSPDRWLPTLLKVRQR